MASPITAPGRAPIRAVAAFTFHGRLRSPARSGPIVLPSSGGVSRVAKGADCKSAALWLRRFESCLPPPLYFFHLIPLSFHGLGPHLPGRCGDRRSGFGQFRYVFGSERATVCGPRIERGHLPAFPPEDCL